jgi:hypothetical protein
MAVVVMTAAGLVWFGLSTLLCFTFGQVIQYRDRQRPRR